nr:reverse transcriptase domain-containing protein [Tanacetum cinerariifolium]
MSTSTHPITILSDSDIEDAFSSTNTPNYTPTSPNYSPASPGNTFSNPSKNLTQNLLAALAISPFHDDPYIMVMQAYNAELPIQAPIALPPSLIDTIFYHLDELPLERIEEIEDKIGGLGNGRMIIHRDFNRLKSELEEARTQIAGLQKKQMGHDDKVVLARVNISTLEMIIEDIQNLRLPNKLSKWSRYEITRSELVPEKPNKSAACMEGAVRLVRWYERTESVFSHSKCTKDCKVKFATGTLTEEALSWWNSFA